MCVYSLYIELHVYVPVVAVLQSLRLLNCEALEFALDLKNNVTSHSSKGK